MSSLGLSTDFRDLEPSTISGLLSQDTLHLFFFSVHWEVQERDVQERDVQLRLGSSKPQLELETTRSRRTCQLQPRIANCNLEKSSKYVLVRV